MPLVPERVPADGIWKCSQGVICQRRSREIKVGLVAYFHSQDSQIPTVAPESVQRGPPLCVIG